MAAKHLFLFLFLALLSISHARSVEMFNKVPSKINENVVLKETQVVPNKQQKQQQEEIPFISNDEEVQIQEPNFIPEKENSYGLYGHESGQLPPATTTTTTTTNKAVNLPINPQNKAPLSKYLPKNYNPVAYVTEPEDFSETDKTETYNNNNNGENYYNNNNGENNYYNEMKDSELMNKEITDTENNNNYYKENYNNVQQQNGMKTNTRFIDTSYTTPNKNNENVYRTVQQKQQQGMSDTRYLHNGRYYYDINAEKYSRGPYENSQEIGLNNQQYNTNSGGGYNYGNVENSSYQNNYNEQVQEEQYQDEEDLP